jgi:hypothetical protein
MRAVCARTAVYQVQPSEFQLRPLHRGVVRPRVLVRACHLVRRGRQDAGDIFPEVRLRGATAYRGAARWDAFGQVLPDENSEARRDEVVRQPVALPVEAEIFGLAEKHLRVALHPHLFLPRNFQLELQQQDAARLERLAGSARQAEAERLDAGLMAQLRILLGQRAQRPQELLPASRRRVNEQADAHWSLRTLARARTVLQQGASPGRRESHRAPQASPSQTARRQPFPAPPEALLAQARTLDARRTSSPQSPLIASRLLPQLP